LLGATSVLLLASTHTVSLKIRLRRSEPSHNRVSSTSRKNTPRYIPSEAGIPGESVNPGALEILYTQFITSCSEPLCLVDCPEFCALLDYLNQEVDSWLPQSHNTVREWVLRQLKIKKDAQIQRLQSFSDTHIMVGHWSSPNQLPLLEITALYVCEDGKLEKSVHELIQICDGRDW
jgi:hypothetical protein